MHLSRLFPLLCFVFGLSYCSQSHTETQHPPTAPKIPIYDDPLLQLEQTPKTIELYLQWVREPVDKARDLRASLANARKRLKINKKNLRELTAAAYAGNPQDWPDSFQATEAQEVVLQEFLMEVERTGLEMRAVPKRAEFANEQISMLLDQLPQLTKNSIEQLQIYFGVPTEKAKRTKTAMSALRTVGNIAGIAVSASSGATNTVATIPHMGGNTSETNNSNFATNPEYQAKVRGILELSAKINLDGQRALEELQTLPIEVNQINLSLGSPNLDLKPIS